MKHGISASKIRYVIFEGKKHPFFRITITNEPKLGFVLRDQKICRNYGHLELDELQEKLPGYVIREVSYR